MKLKMLAKTRLQSGLRRSRRRLLYHTSECIHFIILNKNACLLVIVLAVYDVDGVKLTVGKLHRPTRQCNPSVSSSLHHYTLV